MTLITVVYYDFVIFSRSKSRIFEKPTLSPCGYFSENPTRKINLIFLFRPFYARLKTPRRKKYFRFLRERTFFRRHKPDCREF